MFARVPDPSVGLPAPWAVAGSRGRHRPVGDAEGRHRPVADDQGRHRPVADDQGRHRPVADDQGRHRPAGDDQGRHRPTGDDQGRHRPAGADGRHRARVTDRLPTGSRRVMAAVVAIAAVGGGGGLLLDHQARTVAQPEQPTLDPVTPGSPVAPALAAQPLAQPPPARPAPAQVFAAQPPDPAAGPRPPDAQALTTGTPGDLAPARRPPSSTRTPERSPTPSAANRAEPSTVDLAGWRLTLPTKGDNGGAALVDPLNKVGPWLNRAANGAFTFWAPSDGATTKNSQHARTELVSRQNFTAGQDPRTLRASLAVTQTPSSGDIILGQIHGAGDMKSVPYVMLHYKSGTIEVVVKKGRSGDDANRYQLLTGVPLGARFSFTIADSGDGTMVFSAARGAESRRVSAPVPPAFKGATVRFQAGAYQLGEGGGSDEGGRVVFYGLTEK